MLDCALTVYVIGVVLFGVAFVSLESEERRPEYGIAAISAVMWPVFVLMVVDGVSDR